MVMSPIVNRYYARSTRAAGAKIMKQRFLELIELRGYAESEAIDILLSEIAEKDLKRILAHLED